MSRPEADAEMQDCLVRLEKEDAKCIVSVDELDFKKYRPGLLKSLISTFRKGKKRLPQNGHVVLRFESSAVQPAMISSSWTRQSQVLHREQLEMRTSIA